jgi:hypothetical protein
MQPSASFKEFTKLFHDIGLFSLQTPDSLGGIVYRGGRK